MNFSISNPTDSPLTVVSVYVGLWAIVQPTMFWERCSYTWAKQSSSSVLARSVSGFSSDDLADQTWQRRRPRLPRIPGQRTTRTNLRVAE